MTVYNLLLESIPEKNLTQEILAIIGSRIAQSARASKINVNRITQIEKGITYTVNDYPDSFKARMQSIAIRYLQGAE